MEVWKSIINDKRFPSGRLKYSVPPSPSLRGTFPPPPLKLSTCKRYVGICREINIWSFALEKQLERSQRKAMIVGIWLRFFFFPLRALEFCSQPAILGGGWGNAFQTQRIWKAILVLAVDLEWQKPMSVYREFFLPEIPLGLHQSPQMSVGSRVD